ncbi:unnamed protein product [Heligmosomoides polygyrus]|uniref:Phosphotransferase n=1 Tax=Heligmosomoides polygyrus TaxID=6339 RepID=A0A3P8D2V7_HELPZ|nr:unnamed protein product [Heligmosomoides polygyrus]
MSDDQLREMMVSLEHSMEQGLAKETAASAAVKMLPSYVRAVPNGKEHGDFLALDLGGTNFRVLLIRLHGREAEMIGKIFRVPESVMCGTGEAVSCTPDRAYGTTETALFQLFDHIAECMARFMEEQGVSNAQKLPLGFTFSFPCKQEGLTWWVLPLKGKLSGPDPHGACALLRLRGGQHGIDEGKKLLARLRYMRRMPKEGTKPRRVSSRAKLINWTKGFNASNVEGTDVVTLLREACGRRKDIDIDVVAVLNDTVGTLMACAFKENSCQVGVIVGTGTNACYMEKLSRIGKLEGELEGDNLPDEMIINTEWGAFGDDGAIDSILTDFDKQVDELSINPGKQLFEKMISGMYMGELVRVVLAALSKDGLLFGGQFEAISRRGYFPTKFVSEIESDLLDEEDKTFQKTMQILEDIGVESVSSADCANVAYVCNLISTRAAHLTAAAIATLLNRMQLPYVTVGVDGSVYRFHPSFPQLLDEKIDQLIKGDLEVCRVFKPHGESERSASLLPAPIYSALYSIGEGSEAFV